MSIRLLHPIFLAGVLSPVDGSTLTLSAAMESDLVNQGKAVWVVRPPLSADAGAPVSTIDRVSRAVKSLAIAGGTYGLPSRLGREFTTINLPLNQSAGNPTDYSGNGAYADWPNGASSSPWDWPGCMTIFPDAAGSNMETSAEAAFVRLFYDSFIVGFTPISPITGNSEHIAGQSNLSTTYGLNVVRSATGLITPRIYCSAGVNFSGVTGVATVGGGFVGAKTDAAGYAIGLGTITLNSQGKGVVTIGDIVRFGTDKQEYTITAGDADVSNGGAISFTPPLQKAIPASVTPVTLVGGARVHRVLIGYDAPTQTVTQWVDGAVDFSRPLTTAPVVAADVTTQGFSLGCPQTGLAFVTQWQGFQFLKFPDSGLPINIREMAVQDNLRRRTGLMDVPVFF